MFRWRASWVLVVALCMIPAGEAHARRMANGTSIDDRYLYPEHPATKAGPPVSAAIVKRYGDDLAANHCFFMDETGSLGQVTMVGLLMMANVAGLPPELLRGAVPAGVVRGFAGKNVEVIGQYFAEHALRTTGNDATRAREVLEQAERHEVGCITRLIRYWRMLIDLAPQDRALQLDAEGRWIVTTLLPGSGVNGLPGLIKLLESQQFGAKVSARGYAAARAELARRAGPEMATKPAPPSASERKSALSPTPRENAVSPPARVREPYPAQAKQSESPQPARLEEAAAQLQQLLEHAKRVCLSAASVAKCG